MDVSNLRKTYPQLLDHLRNGKYGKAHVGWIKKCIKIVLSDGADDRFRSYEDLYWYEVKELGYDIETTRRTFKSTLGIVWCFDTKGKLPDRMTPTGFMAAPKKESLLSQQFKFIIDNYRKVASAQGKRKHTICAESNATICFLYHLQEMGHKNLSTAKEKDIISFFFNGEEIIRGKDYVDKIVPVLRTAVEYYGEDVANVLCLLPKMPRARRNYQYLKKEESEKIRATIKDKKSKCGLLEKAIVSIAYYTGMRGTDISSLTLEKIDWDNDVIHIKQSKTGVDLNIPLTAPVGNALWEYITAKRPSESVDEEILVSNRRPFGKVNQLGYHINKVFTEAGVRTEGGTKGVRIFRHHLATSLLANETPSPVISSILGHVDPTSLNPYIDADIEHLRECSVSIESYPIAEEVFEP